MIRAPTSMTPSLNTFIKTTAAAVVEQARDKAALDFMTDVAHPFSVSVICEVLGVPHADRTEFVEWARTRADAVTLTPGQGAIDNANSAASAFETYFAELLEERRRHPREDLASTLAIAPTLADGPSHEEVLAMCLQLLSAGHLPTAGLLGNAAAAVTAHPEHAQTLARHPRRAAALVEEIIRYEGPVQMAPKVTARDVTLNGVSIPRGEIVMLCLGSANRDPDWFAAPDVLGPTRRPHQHVGFGLGPHYCLGAGLARREAAVLLTAWTRAVGDRRVTLREVDWLDTFTFRIPRRLGMGLTSARGEP